MFFKKKNKMYELEFVSQLIIKLLNDDPQPYQRMYDFVLQYFGNDWKKVKKYMKLGNVDYWYKKIDLKIGDRV